MLCAAILDKQVALGLSTGELYVYDVEALLATLVEAQAAKQPARASTAPVGSLPEPQSAGAGVHEAICMSCSCAVAARLHAFCVEEWSLAAHVTQYRAPARLRCLKFTRLSNC